MLHAPFYDQALANQFFLRTFESLAPEGRFLRAKFLPEEFTYVAARLSETAVFSRGERIGTPWERADPKTLVWTTRKPSDQATHLKAERAANQLLIREGMIQRNIENLLAKFDGAASRAKTEIIETLYWNSSAWQRLQESERFVLRRMSMNVEPWMELLSLVPGNDLFDLCAVQSSPLLI